MYQPPAFRETDPEILRALICAHPLGLLISAGAAGIEANPVPFELVSGPDGDVLRCHLSKGNPQARALVEAPDALVVFQGAETYITPSWYPTKRETGKAVPTWDYVVVQVRGRARIESGPEWLLAHLNGLTDRHEAGRAEPWAVSDAPADYLAGQLRGIVGVEIPLAAIEGKWKVSQNRPAADREGVLDGLALEPGPNPAVIAALLRARMPEAG